jgi:hypothetical protein
MQQLDLTHTPDRELYDALDTADRVRSHEGQGRSPEAVQVRAWCSRQKARIRRELQRRGLPTTRPDGRWTGVGRGFLAGAISAAGHPHG